MLGCIEGFIVSMSWSFFYKQQFVHLVTAHNIHNQCHLQCCLNQCLFSAQSAMFLLISIGLSWVMMIRFFSQKICCKFCPSMTIGSTTTLEPIQPSVEQNVLHSYGMDFGGGGFSLGYPLAKALEKMHDNCLDWYSYLY